MQVPEPSQIPSQQPPLQQVAPALQHTPAQQDAPPQHEVLPQAWHGPPSGKHCPLLGSQDSPPQQSWPDEQSP
jgi:hypothetical protein